MATKKKTLAPAKAKTPKFSDDVTIEAALTTGPKSLKDLKSVTNDPKLGQALARLRRQGRVEFRGGRWFFKTLTLCPKCAGKGWVK
jgi:hypothetical protein